MTAGRKARPRYRCWLVAVLLVTGSTALGHRMDRAVTAGEAHIVMLSYPFGAPPMFEPYRIYAPRLDTAFQTGRTDRLGRVSFLPDRPGDWRVVISTEDGHGTEAVVRVHEGLTAAEVPSTRRDGLAMTMAGIGYLLGAAGALVLWRNRRRAAQASASNR